MADQSITFGLKRKHKQEEKKEEKKKKEKEEGEEKEGKTDKKAGDFGKLDRTSNVEISYGSKPGQVAFCGIDMEQQGTEKEEEEPDTYVFPIFLLLFMSEGSRTG